MFQIQVVSLADWQQKVGAKVLMDSLENLLGEEQRQYWQEPVSLADEMATEERQLAPIKALAAEKVVENALGDAGQAPSSKPDDLLVVGQEPRAGVDGDGENPAALDGGRRGRGNGEGQSMANLVNARGNAAREDETEECVECGTKGKVVFLACDGPGKGHNFCWKCNGYSSAPLDELNYPGSTKTAIRTYVFCAEHLELECCTRPYELYSKKIGRGDRLSIGDFVNHVQAEEARHIVRIFSYPNRQFSILSIDPDGCCMFVSVARALGLEWADLVKEMKAFANDYLKDDENTASMNDLQEVRRLWRQLDPRKASSVHPFWSSEAADFLIPMLAAHLNAANAKAVQIRVWTIENGVLEMPKLVYPEGRAEEFRAVVDLLKSNGVVEHYDLMRRLDRR